MKQVDLTKLSKEELMERIKTRCAKELKVYKFGGGIVLVFIMFMVANMLWNHNATAWEYSLISLAFMIEFIIEGWWMNKITKCEEAKTLMDTYEKYLKFEKKHFSANNLVAVLLVCLIFPGILPSTLKSSLFAGILICCFPFGSLGAYIRRNKAIAQDVDRLRTLIGN